MSRQQQQHHCEGGNSATEEESLITFQPFQTRERVKEGRTFLEIWGHTPDSRTALVIIDDPPIFCFMELPIVIGRRRVIWKSDTLLQGLESLCDESMKAGDGGDRIPRGKHIAAPTRIDIVEGRRLYFFSDSNRAFARIWFKTKEEMSSFVSKFSGTTKICGSIGSLRMNFFEIETPIADRLFVFQECARTGWLTIEEEVNHSQSREGVRYSTAHTEIYGRWSTMKPARDGVDVPLGLSVTVGTLAWDIETYSDNHRKMPDSENPLHVCYQISCVYEGLIAGEGVNPTTFKILLTTVKTDPIPGVQVRVSDSEENMILDFADVIRVLDPTVLIGYNVFKYDYPYLFNRIPIQDLPWPEGMSRVIGEKPAMITKSWFSKAYGQNSMKFPDMGGRLSIDLLPIIRRDFSFPKYTLDYVSNHFLGRGKHDVSAQQMFKAYEKSRDHPEDPESVLEMTRVARYCVEDSQLVLDLFSKLNVWISLIEMSSVVGVGMMELFTGGQQMRCVSLIYKFCKQRKDPQIIMDKRLDPPDHPFEGALVVPPIIGISRGVHVLDFNSLYPSIIIESNICYTTLIHPAEVEQMLPEEYATIETEGSGVAKAKRDDSDDDSSNDSDSDQDFDGDDDNDTPAMELKESFSFVKPEVFKGILPEIASTLIESRRQVRRQMAEAKEALKKATTTAEEKISLEILITVLDKRQNAQKVSCNSLYGILGVRGHGGMLPLIEGAMSITARGRSLITRVNEYLVSEFKATIVAGDTDSAMFTVPDLPPTSETGKMIAKQVSSIFPDPLNMEYEKTMDVIFFTKKRYAALEVASGEGKFVMEGDGVTEKIYTRGTVMVRRDNFKLLRDVFADMCRGALLGKPAAWAREIVKETVRKIKDSEIRLSDLAFTRSVKENYASANYPMAIFREALDSLGKRPETGERVEYVVVDPKTEGEKLGHRFRELRMFKDSQFFEGTEEERVEQGVLPMESISTDYYVVSGLRNPINKLCQVVWGIEDVFSS